MIARIYLEDECPRIGCGWRTVDVKLGRKWAYFTDTANGNRSSLPKAQAEKIIEESSNDSQRDIQPRQRRRQALV